MKCKCAFFLSAAALLILATVTPRAETQSEYLPVAATIQLSYDQPLDTQAYNLGGSGRILGMYTGDGMSLLSYGGALDIGTTQLENQDLLTRISLSPRLEAWFKPAQRMGIGAYGQAGFALGIVNNPDTDQVEAYPLGTFSVGAGLSRWVTDGIRLNLMVGYEQLIGAPYSSVTASLGGTFHFRRKSQGIQEFPARNYLELTQIQLTPVFPVFYAYYEDHTIGSCTIRNISDEPIENASVTVNVPGYMFSPKTCEDEIDLSPGEERQVELFALFNESVLNIVEPTKVPTDVSVEFRVGEDTGTITKTETLRMYDRNAITWNDDRKAAAFVSAKDPFVLTVAKNISGIVTQQSSAAVNRNLRVGMGVHAALPYLGLSYVSDPQTPYEEYSKSTDVVDYMQFPRQTLEYGAGDCDDLTVLYCSLMESIGIQTAFITVPGHIFGAFSTGLTEAAAARQFQTMEDFICHNDTVWVPVEITMINEGFLRAWAQGAKQWREHQDGGGARLYPVHQAWALYPPVAISGGIEGGSLPNPQEIAESFVREYRRYVTGQISPQIARLDQLAERRGESPLVFNRYGIIYAQYGLYDQAEPYFHQALETEEYPPALLNLGNLCFMREQWIDALGFYERATAGDPDNPNLLLCLARTNHELENYGNARRRYEQLQQVDPALAEEFSYLAMTGEEATRAAEAGGVAEMVIWEE